MRKSVIALSMFTMVLLGGLSLAKPHDFAQPSGPKKASNPAPLDLRAIGTRSETATFALG